VLTHGRDDVVMTGKVALGTICMRRGGRVVNVRFIDLWIAGSNPGGATFSTRNNLE